MAIQFVYACMFVYRLYHGIKISSRIEGASDVMIKHQRMGSELNWASCWYSVLHRAKTIHEGPEMKKMWWEITGG